MRSWLWMTALRMERRAASGGFPEEEGEDGGAWVSQDHRRGLNKFWQTNTAFSSLRRRPPAASHAMPSNRLACWNRPCRSPLPHPNATPPPSPPLAGTADYVEPTLAPERIQHPPRDLHPVVAHDPRRPALEAIEHAPGRLLLQVIEH